MSEAPEEPISPTGPDPCEKPEPTIQSELEEPEHAIESTPQEPELAMSSTPEEPESAMLSLPAEPEPEIESPFAEPEPAIESAPKKADSTMESDQEGMSSTPEEPESAMLSLPAEPEPEIESPFAEPEPAIESAPKKADSTMESDPEEEQHHKSNPKILGVELAPFSIPFHRRMETLAIIHWPFFFLVSPVFIVAILIILLFTRFYWFTLLVFAWQIYDRKTCHQGGRRIEAIRYWRVWKYLGNFFPVYLHKTADLDPKYNYLFGFHPHGIMSAGAMVNFGSEATGFAKKFPGIRVTLLTLSCWFYIPLLRDYMLAMGICDVSRESIDWLLGKCGVGNAAVVVVGGATESLEANPDVHRLYLINRKGFIKRAIVHGAHLVPVYAFGETDVFVQVPNTKGSKYRRFQVGLMKLVGFALPLFHGRGIFNYSMGLIPFRRPINTVVGAPMPVKKILNPSHEEINVVHQEYIDALKALFDAHKTKYGVDKDNELVII